MSMENPPYPDKVIREEVLRTFGLSITKAAEILGVRRATLSDLTNGKTAVSSEMALRLEKAFGPPGQGGMAGGGAAAAVGRPPQTEPAPFFPMLPFPSILTGAA